MIIGSNIRVAGGGNLTLGQGGYDDGQADATHGYAKKDCRYDAFNSDILNRPLANALPTTNMTESWTRTSAGIWNRVYTTGGGGAADCFVLFALPEVIRTGSGGLLPSPSNTAYATHGYKVTSIDLMYTIGTANATAISVTAQAETAQTNNVARANNSTTPLGTVTYQNPVGTTVSVLPVAQQAAPYQCRAVFGTPAFVPANTLTFELELSLLTSCVFTLTGLFINYSLAIY